MINQEMGNKYITSHGLTCLTVHSNWVILYLQATWASLYDQESSQIVPHVPLYNTSTLPWLPPVEPSELISRMPLICDPPNPCPVLLNQ